MDRAQACRGLGDHPAVADSNAGRREVEEPTAEVAHTGLTLLGHTIQAPLRCMGREPLAATGPSSVSRILSISSHSTRTSPPGTLQICASPKSPIGPRGDPSLDSGAQGAGRAMKESDGKLEDAHQGSNSQAGNGGGTCLVRCNPERGGRRGKSC